MKMLHTQRVATKDQESEANLSYIIRLPKSERKNREHEVRREM